MPRALDCRQLVSDPNSEGFLAVHPGVNPLTGFGRDVRREDPFSVLGLLRCLFHRSVLRNNRRPVISPRRPPLRLAVARDVRPGGLEPSRRQSRQPGPIRLRLPIPSRARKVCPGAQMRAGGFFDIACVSVGRGLQYVRSPSLSACTQRSPKSTKYSGFTGQGAPNALAHPFYSCPPSPSLVLAIASCSSGPSPPPCPSVSVFATDLDAFPFSLILGYQDAKPNVFPSGSR